MKLCQLFIQLMQNRNFHSKTERELLSSLRDAAGGLAHFISIHFKKAGIETDGFNTIGLTDEREEIEYFKSPTLGIHILDTKVLVIPVEIDFRVKFRNAFESKDVKKINEFFIDIVKNGLKTLENNHPLPEQYIFTKNDGLKNLETSYPQIVKEADIAIENFRNLNYRNRFLLKKRVSKLGNKKVHLYLAGHVGIYEYHASLYVHDENDDFIHELIIVKTSPSHIIFQGKVADFLIHKEGDNLLIEFLDKNKKVVSKALLTEADITLTWRNPKLEKYLLEYYIAP